MRNEASGYGFEVARRLYSNYGKHMKTQTLKVVRIGNSRGIRLPASWIAHYRFEDELVAEARADGLWLRTANPTSTLSWEATAKAMAEEHEARGDEFADMDGVLQDGLNELDR